MDNVDELAEARAQLFGNEINVGLLDTVVEAMNSTDANTRKQANILLCDLKVHPDSWLKVDTIIENSKLDQTKYLSLQILEDIIKTRWRTLANDQREGIRTFIVNKITSLSCEDPKSTLLTKMNVVLVEILKKDWPKRYPSFVTDILTISEKNRGICINSMQIFSLLSEDVFDFGKHTMTSAEERYLKENFCSQFELIFQFCLRCLVECPTDDIVTAVLKTVRRFLTWIPTATVFESSIIDILVEKFLGMDNYRIHVLQCLSEIASIPAKNCEHYITNMRRMFYEALKSIYNYVGENPKFAEIYKQSGDESDRIFLSSLTYFLSTFLKEYDTFIGEHHDNAEIEFHHYGLKLLLKLSMVDDVEMWKMCLEYWLQLTSELFRCNPYAYNPMMQAPFGNEIQEPRHPMNITPIFYEQTLSSLRDVVISKMARPEEVLVVEIEGEVVREIIRDTDNINLYRSMKETLTFLTHLNNQETMNKMTAELSKQMTECGFNRPKLSTLCWAIGSISNILQEEDEKRFLVVVIRDLLSLCEAKRGKDNKAAIAANIMYVVGQYHRFLKAHWKFLRTVINKLFEFMHESHEGVQDMACDTFIKITLKCKRHFVMIQPGETHPFLDDMILNLRANTCDLTGEQQCIFYEAMGHIVAGVPIESDRLNYLERLMAFVNETWDRHINTLSRTEAPLDALADISTSKDMQHCVKIFAAVCRSFGFLFHVQLTPRFTDMLAVYQLISTGLRSELIANVDVNIFEDEKRLYFGWQFHEMIPDLSTARADWRPISWSCQSKYNRNHKDFQIQIVKNFKAYKKDFLVLMSIWISQDESVEILKSTFFQPLMDAILFDYLNNIPEQRDSKVLSLLAIIITRMEYEISEFVPGILQSVLVSTLDMITGDMTVFPEHRVNLFQMLLALCTEVFAAFFELEDEQFKYVLESVYWAFQNPLREVAELGLDITKEILDKVRNMATNGNEVVSQLAQNFYKKHFITMLEHIFAVVSDSNQVHIAGLGRYAEILCQLFSSLENCIKVPLQEENPQLSNQDYISSYLNNLFTQHYSNHFNAEQIQVIIIGFFSFSANPIEMKKHLKDYLVKLKELQDEHALDQELFLAEREGAISDAIREKMNAAGDLAL